jgi:hypothetical protein
MATETVLVNESNTENIHLNAGNMPDKKYSDSKRHDTIMPLESSDVFECEQCKNRENCKM